MSLEDQLEVIVSALETLTESIAQIDLDPITSSIIDLGQPAGQEKRRFIDKAAIAAMQAVFSTDIPDKYEWTPQEVARQSVVQATALWDELQASRETK